VTPRAALNQLLASDDVHALEGRLRHISSFHILGIDTWETSHAALLAWFLNPRASHGMGAVPLHRFMLMAIREGSADGMLDAVDLDQLDLSGAEVSTEHSILVPGTERRRRLDVLVSLTVPGESAPTPVLIVEYKVDASESLNQTADYAAWAAERPLTLKQRTVHPLQVFLCPVPSDETPPAAPFVAIGYDVYLGWADLLATLEKTAQAEALLTEWCACLRVRNDVPEEQQERLVQSILSDHADAVAALRRASREERRGIDEVLAQHEEVFARLGVRVRSRGGGVNKGYSEGVAVARAALEDALTPALWSSTGGSGSLRKAFAPFATAVTNATNGLERLSGFRLQLYADRPVSGRFRLVLEVIGDLPGISKDASRELRLICADTLRRALAQHHPDLPLRQKATVLNFVVLLPNVLGPKDDTEDNVAAHRGEFADVAARIRAIEGTLTSWSEGELTELLERA